jgi:hypothetical protein
MAYDPGFPNEDDDAHLVESKARIKPDYSILSTETKPTLTTADAGRILEYTDNGNRYRWTGTYWQQTHLKGALNIHDADVHNVIVNKYLHFHDTTVETTLAVNSAKEDYQITVTDPTGFVVNDYLHINTTSTETTHPQIKTIVGSVFTLDRRLDVAHTAGDVITKAIINMTTQIGTMADPIIYYAAPEPNEIWHLNRILFEMTHDTAGDLGKFGNHAELSNGVVIRALVNSEYGTLTNWKNNGNIKTDMYDVAFDNRSGGGGSFGTSGRGSFNRAGAILRLDGANGDRFEVWIQDALNDDTLNSFTMKAQGHLESE